MHSRPLALQPKASAVIIYTVHERSRNAMADFPGWGNTSSGKKQPGPLPPAAGLLEFQVVKQGVGDWCFVQV